MGRYLMRKYSVQKIGKEVESLLKELLCKVSFDKNFNIFSKRISLMKSGRQFGLDLNWDINFKGDITYRWFFEAKGNGFEHYKRHKEPKSFRLNLISDKLLQILSNWKYKVDCWCLFIPYQRLDGTDEGQLEDLEIYFPFKIVIMDFDYLQKIQYILPNLYRKIYLRDTKIRNSSKKDYIKELEKDIIQNSKHGRFLQNIHKEFIIKRNEIVDKCKRYITFNKEVRSSQEQDLTIQKKTFYFLYDGDKYFVDEQIIKSALELKAQSKLDVVDRPESIGVIDKNIRCRKELDKENLLKVLQSSKSNDNRNLFDTLKKYLERKDIPFLHLVVRHMFTDYLALDFSIINSSHYFGLTKEKPIFFETIIKEE